MRLFFFIYLPGNCLSKRLTERGSTSSSVTSPLTSSQAFDLRSKWHAVSTWTSGVLSLILNIRLSTRYSPDYMNITKSYSISKYTLFYKTTKKELFFMYFILCRSEINLIFSGLKEKESKRYLITIIKKNSHKTNSFFLCRRNTHS